MGKGKRERARRRASQFHAELVDTSTLKPDEPSLSHDERLVLLDVLTRSANRRGVVTGIVAVRQGEVDREQLKDLVESNPSTDVFVLNIKEET